MNHVAVRVRRRVRCLLGGKDVGVMVKNPLSEKLSENGIGFSGFFIFLPTYSRKYSLSKNLKLWQLAEYTWNKKSENAASHADNAGSNPAGITKR